VTAADARSFRWPRALRLLATAALLAALAWWLDADALAARFAELRPAWVALALAISLPQMALLAYRWRLTASRLGMSMTFRSAVAEYYLGCFLNQVLPGGWLGDASRAWRHARAGPETGMGPALRAVILERASGQVVMGLVAALSLASLPLTFGARRPGALLLAALGLIGGLLAWRLLAERVRGPLAALWRDARAALLARDALPAQLLTSTLVTASYLATYLTAARAVGVTTPLLTLLPLVAPVLLSMLIPATVAGWGVREAAAAGLWSAVGLTAEDGVAISAAYGLVVLISTLPGALVLVTSGRGRRAGRRPDARDGTSDAARSRGSRSAAE
jgi:uncharacterized membrane protein YbhN (UPF0104 family)